MNYSTPFDWYFSLPVSRQRIVSKTARAMVRCGMGSMADCVALIYSTTQR